MILELNLVDISIWWTIKLYRYPRCPKRILINRYVTSIFHFSISATAIIRTAIILDSQRKPFLVNSSKKLFYYRSHFTAHCSPQFILCRNQMRFISFTTTNSIIIFKYFIGYVGVFHLLLFVLSSCISASKLFIDTLSFVKKNRLLLLSSIGGILAMGIIGLSSTTEQIVSEKNSQLFKAAKFADHYLESDLVNKGSNNENNAEEITRI